MKISKVVFVSLCFSVLLAVSGRAGEPEKEIETIKSVLPGTAVVHLKTGNFEKTIKGLEDFAIKASAGVPNLPPIQSGSLMQGIKNAANGMIDNFLNLGMDAVFHAFICIDEKTKKPGFTMAVPVMDFAKKISSLKELGLEVPEPAPGIFKFTKNGDAFFLRGMKNGYALVSPKLEYLQNSEKFLPSFMDLEAKKKASAASFVVTIDIAKLMTLYDDKIEKFLDEKRAGIEKSVKDENGIGEKSEELKRLVTVLPKYFEKISNTVHEVKSIRAYFYIDGQSYKSVVYFTPKVGTNFQKFTDSYVNIKPKNDLLGSMPADSASVSRVTLNKKSNLLFVDLIKEIIEDVNMVLGEKNDGVFTKAVIDNLNAFDGEQANSLLITQEPGKPLPGVTKIYYYDITDYPDFYKSIDIIYDNVGKYVKKAFDKALGEEGVVDFELKLKKLDKKIDDVELFTIKVNIKNNKPENVNAQTFVQTIKKSFAEIDNTTLCRFGNKLVIVIGKDSLKIIEGAIKAIKLHPAMIGNDKVFSEMSKAYGDAQISFIYIKPIDLIKLMIAGFSENDATFKMIWPMVATVPASKVPCVITSGVKQGKKDEKGNQIASLRVMYLLPAASASEIIRGVMHVQTMVMSGGLGGGMGNEIPAPDGDFGENGGDDPVDAF